MFHYPVVLSVFKSQACFWLFHISSSDFPFVGLCPSWYTSLPQISDGLDWWFIFIGGRLWGCPRWFMCVSSPWESHFLVYTSGIREADLELPAPSKEKALQCTSFRFWANLDGFRLYPLALPQEFFLSAESSDIALLSGPNFIPWDAP